MPPLIPENDMPTPLDGMDCASCADRLHELALGILPAGHVRSVVRHLEECDACRTEYVAISRVTRLLPFLAEPDSPSPDVKNRLLARLGEPEQEAIPRSFGNPWAASEPEPEQSPAPGSTSGFSWQRWVMPGIVAPLAICLMVLAAWTNSLHNEVASLRGPGEEASSVFSTPQQSPYDLQLYEFRPACENCTQAAGQLGGNPDRNVGVVVAWNLDPTEKHQVWCINERGEKQLVTDLEVEFSGSVYQTVSFPEPIGGYQQIYVARHDGSTEPDAELLVAMNERHGAEGPPSTPVDATS